MLETLPPGFARAYFLLERELLDRVQGLDVPALLVFGEHEMLYDPYKVAKRAKRSMPGLATDVIEGAGHAAIYDKPDEVNAVVVDYLRGPPARA